MFRWLALLLAAAAASAQPLSFGFKAGSLVNDPAGRPGPFSTRSLSQWTGGPALELHLPRRFSIALDALYRSERTNTHFPFQLGQQLNAYLASSEVRDRIWDVPLLLRYRLTARPVSPFLTGGALWSRRSTEGWVTHSCLGPSGSCRPPDLEREFPGGSFRATRNRFGPAAGGGIEIRTRHLRISPEVRWHHLRPRANQVTAIVGFTFGR